MVTDVGATYGHYIISFIFIIAGVVLFIKALNKKKKDKQKIMDVKE